jgi:hypothetical protein
MAPTVLNLPPSASTTLEEGFPERAIFGTWGTPLHRQRYSWKLFPECCTRGRLPRVLLGLPRVQLALGEACGCHSATSSHYQPHGFHPLSYTTNRASTELLCCRSLLVGLLALLHGGLTCC